jgi:type IV secretory pathway TrbL component
LALSWFGLMTEYLSLLDSLMILGVLVLVLGTWSYKGYKKLAMTVGTS